MATDDTAALVVALSAQFTKFEKDMKAAVGIADKQTREIETRFAAMNSKITAKLSELGSSLSSNLGFAGTLLRTLGPAGIAAAAGLGTAVGGIIALTQATAEFAEKARRLKDASETAGLTITQFKLLGQAGQKVGLDFDETTAFFTKFISNIEALRVGGGPLFDALLKIDTELLRQLSVTKSSAEAINILVAAYKRLDDQAKRLDLAKAAGGRGALSAGQLLESLGRQGTLAEIEAKSPGIDEGQIERAAKLKVEIDGIAKKTANIWGGMFSDTILQNQKNARQNLLDIAEYIDRIVRGRQTLFTFGGEGGVSGPDDFMMPPGTPQARSTPSPRGTFNDRFSAVNENPLRAFTPPPPPPPKGPGSPSVELAILQKNLALLGDALTVGEQWRLKRLEIAAAAEKGGLSDGIATRALDAFRLHMIAAAVATRERLGIAGEEQIAQGRLAQLQQDRIKFGLSENEVQRATVVILREAKQTADALAVRQAYLPGLKQLELDAQNMRKSLDTLTVNSLNNLETALVDIVTGTKSASEAFKAMANAIIADLARIAIRQSITGPIAGALGGLFGGGGNPNIPNAGFNQFGNPFGNFGSNAAGTDNWRGGPTWVGERGPELINLPRGAQVIPNHIARSGGGGVTLSPSTSIVINGPGVTMAEVQMALAQSNRALAREIDRGLPGRMGRMQNLGN